MSTSRSEKKAKKKKNLRFSFFSKMAAGGYLGLSKKKFFFAGNCLKHILEQKSEVFIFFQNGRRRPSWIVGSLSISRDGEISSWFMYPQNLKAIRSKPWSVFCTQEKTLRIRGRGRGRGRGRTDAA